MGYWNNRLLRDKKYIGDAVIEGYMLKGNGIPYAIPNAEAKVKGEIWDIEEDAECLDFLDELEGHPDWYRRTSAKTTDGQDVELYVYQHPKAEKDCPINAKGEYYWE
jgi:gamma-glutamylcyclotransferase (GGCT)/AIG2-like uncharacterized protein YtfP